MIELDKQKYHYQEEINYGILDQIPLSSFESHIILDVGCGQGNLSEAIKKKGYLVWGIENHPDALEVAKRRIDKVIAVDLTNTQEIAKLLADQQFDAIIFSDVLEHIYDPLSILRFYSLFLKKEGMFYISVPNALVWTNRIVFLFGIFRYSDSGVMDRTHIRFFTFKTAVEVVEAAGCKVVKKAYTPFVVRAFLPIIKKAMNSLSGNKIPESRQIIDAPLYKFYMRFLYPLEHLLFSFKKTLFAFRIIIVGQKL